MKKAVYLAGFGILLEILFLVMAFSDPKTKILGFMLPYLLSFLLYFLVLRFFMKKEEGFLQVIIVFAFLFRLTFFFLMPVFNSELYRLSWDTQVQGHGFSPYELAPKHYTLEFLRENWFTLIPLQSLFSYYGPGVEGLLYVSSFVSSSLSFLKLIALLGEAVLVFFLLKLMQLREVEESDVLLYVWNPLVVLEVAWHGSFWVLGSAMLFLALYLLYRKRYHVSAFFSGVAITMNPVTLFSSPLFVKRAKFLPYFILGLLPFAIYYPTIVNLLYGLRGYFSLGNGYVYFLLEKILPTKEVLPVLAGLFAASLILIYFSNFSPIKKAYLLTASLLFLSPQFLPAFLLLLIPFLIFYRTKALLLFTMLVNFYFLGAFSSLFTAEVIFALEYIPAVLLLAYGVIFKDQ